MEVERESLRETIGQLRAEIRLLNEATSDSSSSSKEGRWKLMGQLEAALYRQAELEEQHRLVELKRHAIETGMVAPHAFTKGLKECKLHLKDCSFGTERMLVVHRYKCCGEQVCQDCEGFHKFSQFSSMDVESWKVGTFITPTGSCPFCHSSLAMTYDKLRAFELGHAQAGKAWAQACLGERCLSGQDDQQKAMHWFTLAAKQGDSTAQAALAKHWFDGGQANGVTDTSSRDIALQFALAAARQGHDNAQHLCATILMRREVKSIREMNDYKDDDDDAFKWLSLSAAQDHGSGLYDLATLWHKLSSMEASDAITANINTCTFRALYWYKKVARQGMSRAQKQAANVVLEIKRGLYGGVVDRVGYSGVPEACLWYRKAASSLPDHDGDFAQAYVQKCGCCAKEPSDGDEKDKKRRVVKLHRCKQCWAIAYCSKDCQLDHWNMGHKVDCKKVVALQKAIDKELFKIIEGPDDK